MSRLRISSLVLIIIGLLIPQLFAQSDWQLKCLTGRQILCITVEDSGRVVAGVTHQQMDGLYIANNATNDSMTAVSFSLWVDPLSIVQVQPQLFFFVGYGQNESTGGTGDGIFKLQWVSQYTFTRMNTYAAPTAITARVLKGTTKDTIHVFLSNGPRITHGQWKGYPPLTLDTLKSPAAAFGTGTPYCAAMCVYGKDKKCYAGGYDKATTNPGVASLLYEVRIDSMAVLKSAMNVTSLAGGSNYLYVGTKDSGIYRYQEPATAGGAGTWTHAASPVAAAIVSIVVVAGAADDALYLAAGDGVYKGTSTLTGWTKLGTLPSPPNCLTKGKLPGELFAGTNNGIYRYVDAVGTVNQARKSLPAAARVLQAHRVLSRGTLELLVSSSFSEGQTVSILDLSGRAIAAKSVPANHLVSFDQAGPCLYQVKRGNRVIESGVIVLP